MRTKTLPFLLSFLFLPALVSGEAGYTSANFLKIGMGSRAAAMADSFTAVADDSTALYWNPAGLALSKGTGLSTTHGQWLQGVSNDYIALSQRFGNNGAAGIGFITQSVQGFSAAMEDSLGNYVGQGAAVNASDWVLSAAYADSLGHLLPGELFKNTLAGLKVNLVGQNAITPVGNAFSFEAGFLHLLPQQHLAFGLDIQNVGTAIQDRSQPVLFKAGASWYRAHNFNPGDKLILAADLGLHDDTGFHPSFGTEYRSPIAKDFAGALRLGLRPTDDQYGISFLTFGAGIEKQFEGFDAGFDYAFVPYGAIGVTHRFTLNLRLGAQEGAVLAASPLDTGVDYMNRGQFDLALKVFQEAAGKDPNDAKINKLMGTCLFRMGRLEEAQQATGKPAPVVAAEPAVVAPVRSVPAAAKAPAASVPAQPAAAPLSPEASAKGEAVAAPAAVPAGPLDLGLGYMKQGKYDLALKAFQEAAMKDPDNLKIYKLVGTCQNRLKEAGKSTLKAKPAP